MGASYTTNMPAWLCAASVLIFAFSGFVFFTYDLCVERRQRKINRTAVRNRTVVNSLFPKDVREQLLLKTTSMRLKMEKAEAREMERFLPGSKRVTFLSGSNKTLDIPEEEQQAMDMPIAQVYPETTVLFGDLAGFTSWSSSRDPPQVFVLLETVYGTFDKIAKRRKVFKIETIGDCYVAVTGIPKQTKRHAVNMTRFASEIVFAMNAVVRDLELKLGPGTQDLQLRIGLHSGAVTAGVLRGEKARFQLFGDTVNSNGKPGCIYCSQKTADILLESGKTDWLSKREQMIEAKGKGKMLTYFLDPYIIIQSSGLTPGTAHSDSIRGSEFGGGDSYSNGLGISMSTVVLKAEANNMKGGDENNDNRRDWRSAWVAWRIKCSASWTGM